MPHFYEHLNVLVIPTDACNLKCEYCFHNEYIDSKISPIKMSDDLLRKTMEIILPYYTHVQFIWHGGEPLMMGLDFYKKVIKYQEEYRGKTDIRNSIQTNLTLLNSDYVEFFQKNNFGISSSYDGTQNECLRHNTKAFKRGLEVLRDKKKKCGLIMVVSRKNSDTLIESYEEFKGSKTNYIMNPYTKSLLEDSSQAELQIVGNLYADKMIEFYEYWLSDVNCNIRVKNFLEIYDYIVMGKKNKCNISSCLGKWVCVRPNGDITPCNRYFPSEYSMGNVDSYSDIGQAFESEGFKLLLSQAIERRNKCKTCSIYEYCSGGCNNVALVYGGVNNNNNEMCIANIKIFEHIKNSFEKLQFRYNIGDELLINPYVLRYLEYKD